VTDATRAVYRNRFSIIFSDFFLFDSLLGLDPERLDERAREYLRVLRLEDKVTVEGGRFSTLALSRGQQKRMALLTSWLEDRPVNVFDEWAADQDPGFKEFFYRRLLPDMAAQGKSVVVITHDDRYFDAAHRLVKLDYGRIVPVDAADGARPAPRLAQQPATAG
jgi:putative ATP-binding cassette transporter